MFAKIEDLTAEQKANIELSLKLANTVFASTERLAALNLATARSLFEQSAANVQTLLGAKDVKSFAALQAAQAQPAIDSAFAYSRSVYAIAAETKDEVAKLVEGTVAGVNAKVSGLVDKALKSAPAGSENAVAGIRNAIDAANSAYESINKVAKQVAQIAEANVSAASDATLKAAANVTKLAKKVA